MRQDFRDREKAGKKGKDTDSSQLKTEETEKQHGQNRIKVIKL